jgi:hydroxyacylglutathione hydrolase
MLKVFSLPALKDNYIHIVADLERKTCLIFDPGEAAPVLEFLAKEKLQPLGILITHHHWDHTDGIQELQKETASGKNRIKVYAPAREKADIPTADHFLLAGDLLKVMGLEFRILPLPGHTQGHIAFYEANHGWLFSGDVLFSLGCGRIFEGTMSQHYESLQSLKTLPASTLVYSAHEYTEVNTRFCLEQEPENQALRNFYEKVRTLRAEGTPTIPFSLQQELELNPFLRAPNLKRFSELREARNIHH